MLYSILLILIGTTNLCIFSVPIILEICLDIFSECFLFSCVSKVNPKKLKSSTFVIIILCILGTGVYIFFGMRKTMNLDLIKLMASLLISSHSLIV